MQPSVDTSAASRCAATKMPASVLEAARYPATGYPSPKASLRLPTRVSPSLSAACLELHHMRVQQPLVVHYLPMGMLDVRVGAAQATGRRNGTKLWVNAGSWLLGFVGLPVRSGSIPGPPRPHVAFTAAAKRASSSGLHHNTQRMQHMRAVTCGLCGTRGCSSWKETASGSKGQGV